MTCDLTARPRVILGSPIAMNAGGGAITERRIRISRPVEGSARCRGSRVRDRPNDFCPSTPRPTTHSTSSAISSQQTRTEHSEPRPCRRGARSPPPLEPSGVDGFAASSIPQRDNACRRGKVYMLSRRENRSCVYPRIDRPHQTKNLRAPRKIALTGDRGPPWSERK